MPQLNLAADPILAAEISWAPLWDDTGLPLAIMGMSVVFAALILVSLFIMWLPRLIAIAFLAKKQL